jgi:enterochelin esterase-like enzyme
MEGNGPFDQADTDGEQPPEADGERQGTFNDYQNFDSTTFGYGFQYATYVPTAYQAGKPAALMIFQDGPNYHDVIRVPQIVDKLIAAKEMPVVIVAFLKPTDKRGEEYDTRDEKYPTFIVDEFIPDVIQANYDIVDDPNGWLIGGHSSGGSCAFNVAWYNADKFHKVHTNNGTFVGLEDPGNDAYIDIVTMEAARPLRVSMLSGTNDLQCCGTTWFDANNSMSASLAQAGYAYRYAKSDTSHDLRPYSTNDFPAAMRWMWRGYSLPHYEAAP